MCQIYMAIARDRKIRHSIEHEYETVSHLTIAKAVKLAHEHQSLEACAKAIEKADAKRRKDQKALAETLSEARARCFEVEGAAFKQWLISDCGLPEAFAVEVPGLLTKEYDDEIWLDAMLKGMEARP
jgi:hypothetical protein